MDQDTAQQTAHDLNERATEPHEHRFEGPFVSRVDWEPASDGTVRGHLTDTQPGPRCVICGIARD